MVDFVKMNAIAHQRRAAYISVRVRELRAILCKESGLSWHDRNYYKLRLITEDRAAAAHYKRARELMGIE